MNIFDEADKKTRDQAARRFGLLTIDTRYLTRTLPGETIAPGFDGCNASRWPSV
jgi:hypothetical protein